MSYLNNSWSNTVDVMLYIYFTTISYILLQYSTVRLFYSTCTVSVLWYELQYCKRFSGFRSEINVLNGTFQYDYELWLIDVKQSKFIRFSLQMCIALHTWSWYCTEIRTWKYIFNSNYKLLFSCINYVFALTELWYDIQ